MSSTTNVQNLITTVFRPTYYYDSSSKVFLPHMEMSNIDTYFGNEVFVTRAQVGDGCNNMYVGVGSGQSSTVTSSGNKNLTAIGVSAGATTNNVTNSVYVGYNTGANTSQSDNVIAIGASIIAGGSSNIFIGNSINNVGTSNVFIGHGITAASTVTNKLNINNFIYGDFTAQWAGIGTPSPYGSNTNLDVSGGLYVNGKIGVQMSPVNSLNVNGATQSTGGYYSASGSNTMAAGDVVTIGTFGDGTSTSKLANALITVQDTATTDTHYATGMYVFTGATVQTVSSNRGTGDAYLTFSSSNIQISNRASGSGGSSHLYYWTITHFPLRP